MRKPSTLNNRFCESVTKPGRYSDGYGGHGLSLLVKPMQSCERTSRTWSQALRINGKQCRIGLGSFPAVTLANARRKALANAQTVAEGRDPRKVKRVPSLADLSEAVIAMKAPAWKNAERSAEQWRNSLRDHAADLLDRPVDKIETADLLSVLTPLWGERRETARKVKQRLSAAFARAVGEGHIATNPADALTAFLPRERAPAKPRKALAYEDVAASVYTIQNSGAYLVTKLALEFTVLTAARSGETRGATWDEVDFETAVWTVPASRHKESREHRVPLSGRAVEVLKEAKAFADESGLVFPSATGRVMSDNTLSKVMRENRIDATVHGYRAAFRTWGAERTNAPPDVLEAALSHAVGNAIERAYSRSDHFERRRVVMEQWAAFLSGEHEAGNVFDIAKAG